MAFPSTGGTLYIDQPPLVHLTSLVTVFGISDMSDRFVRRRTMDNMNNMDHMRYRVVTR